MVIRTKTTTEIGLSLSELNAIHELAGISCDGLRCKGCPLNVKGDNCVRGMSREVLSEHNIPFKEHPNEEVTS